MCALVALGGCRVDAVADLEVSSSSTVRLVTEQLPTARVGEAYVAELRADGPEGPLYAWRIIGELPPGLRLRSIGAREAVLVGVLTEAGVFPVDVAVQAGGGDSDRRAFALLVGPADAGPLQIEATLSGDPVVGEPFTIDLVALGAVGDVGWSVDGGTIPGLILSGASEGRAQIEGVPQQAGRFRVAVRATDALGNFGVLNLDLQVLGSNEPLVLLEPNLAPGTVGLPYEGTITAQGGAGGYTWTALDPLPDGLTLDPMGTPSTALVGVPTRDAFYRFRVQVRDSSGATAEIEALYRVDARTLTIITDSLPDGIDTASYRAPIAAAGGTGAYSWRALSPLPPGLSLSSAGTPSTELSGVLEAAGEFELTIEVSDLAGGVAVADFRLRVQQAPAELTILTMSIADGTTCLGYDQQIEAVGGAGGYRWAVTAGNLPPGVSLSIANGPRAELSGAPTRPGTYRFTLSVIDAVNTQRRFEGRITVTTESEVARHIAFAGDVLTTDADTFVADICGPTASPAVRVTPPNDRTELGSVARPLVSPDGRRMAFVGPVRNVLVGLTRLRVARLYVVDLTGPSPSPAVTVIPNRPPFEPNVTDFRWSPDSRKLAFRARLERDITEGNGLYTVDVTNPASPGPIVDVSGDFVRNGEVVGGTYRWSPDSRVVAYVADQRRAGLFEVFFGLPSGSVPASTLPAPGRSVDTYLQWRNDSGGVFFRGDLRTDDDFALYHVALNGSQAGPLTRVSPAPMQGGQVAQDRFWVSPDGRWLVFVGDLGRANSQNVYASRIVGGNTGAGPPVTVNSPFARDRTILQVRWSPTSDALIIHGDLAERERNELFYVPFTAGMAGAPVRLNPALPTEGDVISNAETEFWSADGNWVGFIADARIDEKKELYVVDLRIPQPWQATRVSPNTTNNDLDAFRFEFAPDGSRIALLGDYSRRDQFELWAVDLRGPGPGAAFRLHPPLVANAMVSIASQDTAWKRDGSAIFFRGDIDLPGRTELWMVDLTADGRRPPSRVNPAARTGGDVSRFGFTP